MEAVKERINEIDSCWYVVYTAIRSENKIKDWLEERGYISYVPTQSLIRMWKSRKKQITVPVLSRCVFVRLTSDEKRNFSDLPGSFLMKEKGQYVTISNSEMVALQDNLKKADEYVSKGRTSLLCQMGFE